MHQRLQFADFDTLFWDTITIKLQNLSIFFDCQQLGGLLVSSLHVFLVVALFGSFFGLQLLFCSHSIVCGLPCFLMCCMPFESLATCLGAKIQILHPKA